MKKSIHFILVLFLILFLAFPAWGASVNLNWSTPTVNCDGTAMTDLAGYVIQWGETSGGPYPNLHNVDDPAATSATVNVGTLENTTLYFTVVSIDTSGNRSDDPTYGCGTSPEASVPFNPLCPSPPATLTGAVGP